MFDGEFPFERMFLYAMELFSCQRDISGYGTNLHAFVDWRHPIWNVEHGRCRINPGIL